MQPASTARQHSQGIVIKKTLGNYFVQVGERLVTCAISSKLRKVLIYPTADPNSLRPVVQRVDDIRSVDPVAVGDMVSFVDEMDGSGMITEIQPRSSKLTRLAAGKKHLEQVIVANLDQVIPVFAAAQPAPKWNLLDRYLVSAESLGLKSVVCITKLDLLERDSDVMEMVEIYRRIGYQVILTSVRSGLGLADFQQALQGRVSVLVGKSGVGKTSLLNAIQPELGLRVNQVSQATGKGKHTTTSLEMFPLDFGGSIVDTPGMREFGLWELEGEDIALYFPEMRPWVGQCKYGLDCSHAHEPDCAVQDALQNGQISLQRYNSFLRLCEA